METVHFKEEVSPYGWAKVPAYPLCGEAIISNHKVVGNSKYQNFMLKRGHGRGIIQEIEAVPKLQLLEQLP
jgi:hypothetical protein